MPVEEGKRGGITWGWGEGEGRLKRARAGVLALALTAVAAGIVASGARAQTNQPQQGLPPQASPHSPAGCASEGGTPVQMQSVMALHADGSQAPARDNDGQGRIYTFANEARAIYPPTGFKPFTATDQELATYGFEPRPTDPALMGHWHSLYANYRNDNRSDPVVCKTKQSANWVGTTSCCWSGAVNNGAPPEGYWTAQLGFQQSAFDNLPNCAGITGSSYLTWAGLGGWYGGYKLVQAGTVNGFAPTSDVNELHNFYELIDSANQDTGAQWFGKPENQPHFGDQIYVSVKNVNNDHLEFRWDDQTKGYHEFYPTQPGGYYNGISLTQFIDARTAEYITENSQRNAVFLRKPHLWNTWMFWEQADEASMTNFGRFGVDEYSWRYMQQIETSPPTVGWSGNPGFYDQWENCW